ncbi:MAG: AIPR family protein [Sporomusaceae bacterium]|nr:AIPR family protein [Sporomusaceae bacterium]
MSQNSRIILEQIIKQKHDQLQISMSDSRFFEYFSAMQLLKNYELSYDEIEHGLMGESNDGGADAIYLFVNGDFVKEDEELKEKYKKNVDIEMVIIQAKYTNSFGEDALLKLARLSKNLFNLEFERTDFEGRYTDKVLNAFELFRKTYFDLIIRKPRLKIKYFYTSKAIDVHENVRKQADDLKADVKGLLSDAEIEVVLVGAEELLKLTHQRVHEVYRLSVSENPMSSSGQVFIALSNLSSYYKFITDDNDNLIRSIFESNVRDYQGKTNVNSEIGETLSSNNGEDFWWLNNGVTILATEASSFGGKELVIHNPEIVNGLQTSSEIYRWFHNNPFQLELEKRNILVRVIVPDTEETRDKIIRATNSQTPIPKSSLRVTNTIHRQIEEYMKARGLYYDRRKNFYKNEGKKPKEIISVSFLAQCLMAVLMQKPDFSRARPSTLLEEDESYDKLYNKNNSLNTFYLIAYTGRKIELYLKDHSSLTTTEVNDIRFYVLYAAWVLILRNIYPSNKIIASLNKEGFTTSLMEQALEIVYDIYKLLGGNDKVAKGTKLPELLKSKLRSQLACLD